MSTIVFSNQSSVLFHILQWADIKFKRTLEQKIAAIPRIIINRCIVMVNIVPAITPRAKDPDKTAKFITTIKIALETFDDEIGLLQQATRLKAYKNLVRAYRAALTEVWDLARFADVVLILDTVKDKEMHKLLVMAHRLKVPEPKTHTEVENRKLPTLETITGAMVSTYLSQKLPSTAICKAIGDIFSKLSEAHKAYAEAADGLAQMSTKVSPEHYTLILMAATAPAIQLVLPPGVTSPVTAPQPPPHQATTQRLSPGLNIIQALITIHQSPGSHVRRQWTKVKHQMHHHLRRSGLHQARKLPRHFHCKRWTISPQTKKAPWNPNSAVIVHFQKACQHNVKQKCLRCKHLFIFQESSCTFYK